MEGGCIYLSAMKFCLPLVCKEQKIKCQIKISLLLDMFCLLVCAGLNPLSRTIQGNDPGTTACPPCAG